MTSIPLLSGIAASSSAEFLASYPINLEPVAIDNKIARGQLRATSGVAQIGTGPGVDRGGINWNGVCYRVMGIWLVRVLATGEVEIIGDVGPGGPVALDYSFDRLAINSNGNLFYFDGTVLTRVTDPDLGRVVDMIWIDGYFMATDGTFVVVTELNDPLSVKPLKYGSAETDPDPVTGLMRYREEAYVIGRYSTQVFRNIGVVGFPFVNQKGAGFPQGCVAPRAKGLFAGSYAFVGGGRDEAIGVYVAGQGSAEKISVRAVDDDLAKVPDPSQIVVESRSYRDEDRLLVHIPGKTWVFLAKASQRIEQPIWYQAYSGAGSDYRPRYAVTCYGKIIVGDIMGLGIGVLTDDVGDHFGEPAEWGFDAGLIYNEGKGGIVHKVELIGLPGRSDARIFMSMTRDGQNYSVERQITVHDGQREHRLQWRPNTRFANYLGLRFRGYGMPGFAKIEADIRPLAA